MKKCIVMLSNGLDSRLAVKIMQEKGYDVLALYFKFPFSKDDEKEVKQFAKEHKFKLKVVDGTKDKLLQEYLNMIKEPLHGRGSGFNPCIDCRLFMLKKAKEIADKEKIKLVATGEVLGQRPMSQHQRGLDITAEQSGLKDRLIRPVMQQGIQGRQREKQMALAKKYKIDYPNPAGGCILCEPGLRKRLKYLIERGLNDKEIKLLRGFRHFLIDKCWIVLGKNQEESEIIENIGIGELIVPEKVGPSTLILDKCKKETKDKVIELITAYSKNGKREKFEKYLL